MYFLSVLRSDARVLWRCINKKIILGNKPIEVSSRCNLKIICRTLNGEGKQLPNFPSDKIIAYYKVKDRVPNDFDLIYRVRDTFGFNLCHLLITFTSFAAPLALLIIADNHDYKLPIHLMEGMSVNSINELCAFVGFAYGILGLTLIVVKRFPLRIYRKRNGGSYVACFSNLVFPWKISLMKFKRGDVRRLLESERYPFQLSNYAINGSKVIFIEDHFYKPFDLEYMVASSTPSEQNKKEE